MSGTDLGTAGAPSHGRPVAPPNCPPRQRATTRRPNPPGCSCAKELTMGLAAARVDSAMHGLPSLEMSLDGRPTRILIAQILISPRVLEKIGSKHGVSEQDVRQAFILTHRVEARWDLSEEHECWRVLAVGVTYSGGLLKAALYPVDEHRGCWRLGTAFWAR
jgi:hypothetical protein